MYWPIEVLAITIKKKNQKESPWKKTAPRVKPLSKQVVCLLKFRLQASPPVCIRKCGAQQLAVGNYSVFRRDLHIYNLFEFKLLWHHLLSHFSQCTRQLIQASWTLETSQSFSAAQVNWILLGTFPPQQRLKVYFLLKNWERQRKTWRMVMGPGQEFLFLMEKMGSMTETGRGSLRSLGLTTTLLNFLFGIHAS